MVVCPECGQEIRYISAAPSMGGNGIIPVEVRGEELITESGRKVRGYRAHICRGSRVCTMPERKDVCHAYNGGECMNDFVCKPSL
jgi:hypothetical protein